jgi:predicted GNAT superfamily acetyltransferase
VIEIRELCTPADTVAAAGLFNDIWRDPTLLHPELMLVFAATGNYVAGAYEESTMVGASVAFFTGAHGLHSHITGVAAGMRGRNVGLALKLHQREWALARGVDTIGWTVDPLVRRNIYFNLAKLGATVTAYRPEFYGPMTDAVNAGDPSDRLLITWRLTSAEATAAAAGTPSIGTPAPDTHTLLAVGPDGEPIVGTLGGPDLICALPDDIVLLRHADPALARAWRYALRDTLGAALEGGYRVTGVSQDGAYLLTLHDD